MLLELFDGDRSAVVDLLGVAARTIEKDVLRIERASADRDCTLLAEAAHSLKGASASIGCARISDVSRAIEQTGLAGIGTIEPAPLAELRAAAHALGTDIEAFSRDD